MLPNPLHPAIVHFPIVLVVLLPFAALGALIVIRRGVGARIAWLPVLAIALALSGSAWLAVETGEREEEAVEEVVPERAIHEHEEAAEVFLPASLVMLLLVGAGLVGGRVGPIARTAAPVAALALLYLGYQVGHTGGELVYQYDAPQAYASASYQTGDPAREREDDDERDGRDRDGEERER